MNHGWNARPDPTADVFSGHRPITFDEPPTQEDEPYRLQSATFLLLEDNRIVASTAATGRYAAGELFFARDREKYAVVREAAGMDGVLLVVPHVHSVALVGRLPVGERSFLFVARMEENVNRMMRVLSHGFSDWVDWRMVGERDMAASRAGLRRDDEPAYRAMQQLFYRYRVLCRFSSQRASLTTRERMAALLQGSMRAAFSLLDCSVPEYPEAWQLPFPCVGEAPAGMMSVISLVLGMLLRRYGAAARLMAQAEDDRLPLCFSLLLRGNPSSFGAAREAMLLLERVALGCGTMLEAEPLDAPAGEMGWRVRLSPVCHRHAELYTVRAPQTLPTIRTDDA